MSPYENTLIAKCAAQTGFHAYDLQQAWARLKAKGLVKIPFRVK